MKFLSSIDLNIFLILCKFQALVAFGPKKVRYTSLPPY